MLTRPPNHNLFLKGVFFDEIESLEEKLISNNFHSELPYDQHELKKKIAYDKIPRKFYGIKKWIETTKNIKIKCWFCESLFIGVPIFIPSYVSNTTNGKIFETHGAFCGFGCAYGFLDFCHEFHNNQSYWDKINMLKMLYYQFYNKKINDFYKSPNKYKTEMYGGDMCISDFKKELKKINQLNIKQPM